jgi:iron complex outermembrane recepter protein
VDIPITDTLKTKFMAASLTNDGFMESLSVDRSLGDQDDLLLRGDVLWEPLDNLSLRFTVNDEDKASTDARIVRFTNTANARFKALNVLAGNPDFLKAARAINPAFPDPPKKLAGNRFGPLSHQPGYPGGAVGKWQTKSDNMDDGIKMDLQYYTLTGNWEITNNLALEMLLSTWELDRRQVLDFDGSEFTVTTDDIRNLDENTTIEFHLTGALFDDRANWMLGYYSLDQESKNRFYRWGLWDFAIPNTGPNDPAMDLAARDYVRSYGAIVKDASLSGFTPIIGITDDALTEEQNEDSAWFGELTFSITEKLDATVGVRISEEQGRSIVYRPTDAFRTANPTVAPTGNSFAGVVTTLAEDPDLGSITTNKYALTYQHSDSMMFYGSWGEGFTSGGLQNVNNVGIVALDPEIITTWELGLRSDWLNNTLRINATYFDSEWDGMRVQQLPPDPNNPGASLPFPYPTSDGFGTAAGFEFELTYIPIDNLTLNLGLGLIDTAYSERGSFDGTNGISPNSPFAYAPDKSASLGANYDFGLKGGATLSFSGSYGWMGEYVRDAAYQRTLIDAKGNIVYEPAYGILNARVTYQSADQQYTVALWGSNLTDERYINGGFDARNVWGYDFSSVGRSREVGVSVNVAF